ncbi:MAG TPA: Nif3-like dinuclear metal center hexameric protein [Phycisphaerae bacterium]|nr:Nif3-like dinuclear metal center hexameric protein [Phycisphaerae bacterium]HNU45818.1 Nif3-like dinuclear metal center hexameric protein [Phycisphaerae bacterium]
MGKRAKRKQGALVLGEVCTALEALAPPALAQSWDNVGLLAGDATATVDRVLCCIDLTDVVLDEALGRRCQLIVTYHPPIFRPIIALRARSAGMEALVWRCIRHGVALYAPHTALDAAEGGTNDVLAELCGLTVTEPLEYVEPEGERACKLIVFVPPVHVEAVADAMFAAGAGHIGAYSRCSFRTPGQGTFFGDETTQPAVGERGKLEYVDEIRLETVVPAPAVPAVVAALRRAHPYEEPAFDVYPLKPALVRGIGRMGTLPKPVSLGALARRLRRATGATVVQLVGDPDHIVTRAVVAVGSAGSLPLRAATSADDVIVTGEIRHHDALTIHRQGCTAIALGHWASERPVLPSLARRLMAACPGLDAFVSAADADPFRPAR